MCNGLTDIGLMKFPHNIHLGIEMAQLYNQSQIQRGGE